MDFVRAKPGQLARLVRYYEENWGRARATVIKQGGISGYLMLVRADSLDEWDIILQTEYPDSAAFARREETFAPVLAAMGRILVDGFDRTALGDIVHSRTMRVGIVPRSSMWSARGCTW